MENMTIGDMLTAIQKQGGDMPFAQLFDIVLEMPDGLHIYKVCLSDDKTRVILTDFED